MQNREPRPNEAETYGKANPGSRLLPSGTPNPYFDPNPKRHGSAPLKPVQIPDFGHHVLMTESGPKPILTGAAVENKLTPEPESATIPSSVAAVTSATASVGGTTPEPATVDALAERIKSDPDFADLKSVLETYATPAVVQPPEPVNQIQPSAEVAGATTAQSPGTSEATQEPTPTSSDTQILEQGL